MVDGADAVSVAQAVGVLVVTLDHPATGNALSPGMIDRLTEVFSTAAQDASVGSVLMRGSGAHFCTGGDVRDLRRLIELPIVERCAAFAQSMARANTMIRAFVALEMPVVVACQGVVAGGGLTFALAADVALTVPTTRLLFSHQRVGLPPDGGLTALLPPLVGPRRARELILTAATVEASDALNFGLVSRIVDQAALQDEARAQADLFAQGPGQAARAAKRLLRAGQAEYLTAQLEAEREAVVAAVRSPDFEEGVRAFLGRRAPRFGAGDQSADSEISSPSTLTA